MKSKQLETGFMRKMEPHIDQNLKSPWDFSCPRYDERSSCYVNAGHHQGVGKINPVGHSGPVKQRVEALPYGKVKTLKDDGVRLRNENLDIRQ